MTRFRHLAATALCLALSTSPTPAQTWQDISANVPGEMSQEQFSNMASDGIRLYVLGDKGVFVSADNGDSFTAINDVAGGGPDLEDQTLRFIKFVNGEIWISGSGFVGTGLPPGARLHRLTPGESTWQPSSGGLPGVVSEGVADDLTHDPVSGDYFITLSTGGIYASSDGGANWLPRVNGLGGIGSPSSVVAIGGAALTSRPLAGVLRTTNQGHDWNASTSFGTASIGNMIGQNGRLMIVAERSLHFSDDGGIRWHRVDSLPHGNSVLSGDGANLFAVSRNNITYEQIAYSASGGLTWHLLPRDGLPPVPTFSGYFVQKLLRHGDYLYLRGKTLDNSFLPHSTQLHRLDVSAFAFLNDFQIVIPPKGKGMLVGQSHVLEVYASGPSLSYQWQKNGDDLPGATSRTLPLNDVEVGDSGDYTVVVSSPGETPVTSSVATISVFEQEAGRWDPIFDQADINVGGRVHLRPGGEAIVVKTHSNPLVIARIGPDGGRLQHASSNTTTANDTSASLIDQDGRIVAAFKHSSNSNAVRRFDGDSFGLLSTLILGPNTSSVRVRDMVEVPGKGYAIVGNISSVGTGTAKHFALVGYDNLMDTSFAPGAGPDTSSLSRVTCAPDGNVWVCGQGFSTWSGIPANRGLVRIDATGAIHGVFPDVGGTARADFVHALGDGRLLVLFGASGARPLYALHSNGNRDTSFNAANHTITDIQRVAGQPDGKIILVGNFTSFGGVPAAGYIRLHPDGTVDESFYTATGFSGGVVNDVTYDPRGYIYLSATASSSATFQGQGPVGGGPVRIFAAAAGSSGGGGTGGSFSDWEALQSLPAGQRGANASPAGDGVANLVKYAVGGQPLENVFDRLPVVGHTVVDDERYPTIAFIRDTSAGGVAIEVEVAADLGFAALLGSTVVSTENLGDGTERVTVRSNASFASRPRQFFRLHITGD